MKFKQPQSGSGLGGLTVRGGWPLGFLVSCQVTLLKSFEANFLSPHLVINLRTEFHSGAQSSEQRQQPFHFTGAGWGVLASPTTEAEASPSYPLPDPDSLTTSSLPQRMRAHVCVRVRMCVFVYFVLFGCEASSSSVYHVGQKQTLPGDNTAILILPVQQI